MSECESNSIISSEVLPVVNLSSENSDSQDDSKQSAKRRRIQFEGTSSTEQNTNHRVLDNHQIQDIVFNREKRHWSLKYEDVLGLNNLRILMQFRIWEIITRSAEAKTYDVHRTKNLAADIEYLIFSESSSFANYSSPENLTRNIKLVIRYRVKTHDAQRIFRQTYDISRFQCEKMIFTITGTQLDLLKNEVNFKHSVNVPPHMANIPDIRVSTFGILGVETISTSSDGRTVAKKIPCEIVHNRCDRCSNVIQLMESKNEKTYSEIDDYFVSFLHLDSRYATNESAESTLNGKPLRQLEESPIVSLQEKKYIAFLLSISHSLGCKGACRKFHCMKFSEILNHIDTCKSITCTYESCAKYKIVRQHSGTCRDRNCVICGTVARISLFRNINSMDGKIVSPTSTCVKCNIILSGGNSSHSLFQTPLYAFQQQQPPQQRVNVTFSHILDLAKAGVQAEEKKEPETTLSEEKKEPETSLRDSEEDEPVKPIRRLRLRDPRSKKRSRDEDDI